MESYLEKIQESSSYIRGAIGSKGLEVGLILGSGLGRAVPPLDSKQEVSYSQIPGFPQTTVQGHKGSLVLGSFRGKGVAVMQGRLHFYEGYNMADMILPLRVLKELGMKTLIITSAVGSMRKNMPPGSFVFLKDHINFMGHNPLRGFMNRGFGPTFPDMTVAYDPILRKMAMSLARKHKVHVREGVYMAVGGPSYETPAEIRAFQKLGADVVGMSVVPEVIASRQMGLKVLGMCWIANMASGIAKMDLNHRDVLTSGERISDRLKLILEALLEKL